MKTNKKNKGFDDALLRLGIKIKGDKPNYHPQPKYVCTTVTK